MTDKTISVMLVDDHSQVHRSLAIINDSYPDVRVVAHANNGAEAIRLLEESQPDVILMDVVMPTMNGIEATRIIHERYPQINILALSSFQGESDIQDMLHAGAVGYVLKNSSLEELVNAIRVTQSGKSVFSAEVTSMLFRTKASPQDSQAEPAENYGLSERELEVLTYMVKGYGNKEIAQALTISESTAKFHVRSILAKLNVSGRVEAVAFAVENKLIEDR